MTKAGAPRQPVPFNGAAYVVEVHAAPAQMGKSPMTESRSKKGNLTATFKDSVTEIRSSNL